MKTYPTIPKDIRRDLTVYVFDKLDGSNIRCEWTRKSGFNKFGSRRVLINEQTRILGEAVTLLREKEKDFDSILRKNRIDKCTLFFEFFGENSFAGNHTDEEHTVSLIDIDVFKRGVLPPSDFIKMFDGKVETAALIDHRKINLKFIESVQNGILEGMTFEGVVCKARNPKKTLRPVMFKIKNYAWLNKLKTFCGDDAEMFKRLA